MVDQTPLALVVAYFANPTTTTGRSRTSPTDEGRRCSTRKATDVCEHWCKVRGLSEKGEKGDRDLKITSNDNFT